MFVIGSFELALFIRVTPERKGGIYISLKIIQRVAKHLDVSK